MTITWIRFAVANIFRNRRRSFYTIIAIAFGYAAVNAFGGFTSYIFRTLKDSNIYAQANGHITIFKKGFLTEGRIDPLKYLINLEELEMIRGICSKDPRIEIATPQLQTSGLISNGQVSTIFIATGGIPTDTYRIQSQAKGVLGKLKYFDGNKLEDDVPHGVGLTFGLAEKLDLTIGSNAIGMAPTVDGRVNALDMQVFQLYNVPVEQLNDKLMMVPLKFAQLLYDTESVDRITILLRDDNDIEPVRKNLQYIMDQKDLHTEAMTWEDLSPFYTKVKGMFDIIFVTIFTIVLIIVVASVINTISMSVMERTREIGTLRSLGLKRQGITKLFALESAMLGVLGSILGMVLTFLSWVLMEVIQPQWIPPISVRKIPLEIHLVPGYFFLTFAFLAALSAIVAIIPARRAAYGNIVDALGHV